MSTDNPSITVSDIVTDVENRLGDPGVDTATYLPWVSYAYQKLYHALASTGQNVKETLFGTSTTFDLTAGTAEYSINSNMSRFGGFIKVELRYGASGDDWIRAKKLDSLGHWKITNNVSTSYRSKDQALYYRIGDTIGFIPTPPAGETAQTPQARVYHINRPYQLTDATDVIDLPYRYIWPINNYVQARAIQRENEEYGASLNLEVQFERELDQVAEMAMSEFSEDEETNFVRLPTDSPIFTNPIDNG
jgi:hypothetical protein